MNTGESALRDLFNEYRWCEQCPVLCDSRTQPVFGYGNPQADIFVVGSAPSEASDEVGEPFAGKAGNLLFQLMAKSWPEDEERLSAISQIQSDEEYYEEIRDFFYYRMYFTDTILCRPPEGRLPVSAWIKSCRSRLHRQIYAVDPKIIVALGGVAASALLGKKVSPANRNGEIFDISIVSPSTEEAVRYPMMALLHPRSLEDSKALVNRKEGAAYETLQCFERLFHLLQQYDKIRGA